MSKTRSATETSPRLWPETLARSRPCGNEPAVNARQNISEHVWSAQAHRSIRSRSRWCSSTARKGSSPCCSKEGQNRPSSRSWQCTRRTRRSRCCTWGRPRPGRSRRPRCIGSTGPRRLQSGASDGQSRVGRTFAAPLRRRDLSRGRDRLRGANPLSRAASAPETRPVGIVSDGRAFLALLAGIMVERPALRTAGSGRQDHRRRGKRPGSRPLRNDRLRLGVRESVRIAREILLRGGHRAILPCGLCAGSASARRPRSR